MWFVYILLCFKGRLYTGITPDLQRRFELHKSGKGAKFTKTFKPLRIIYTESFSTRSSALKREYEIKSWSRDKKIRDLNLYSVLS